jgi:hypothetical protein
MRCGRYVRPSHFNEPILILSKLKLAFDPLCLLNCDKVVRIEKPKPGEVEKW